MSIAARTRSRSRSRGRARTLAVIVAVWLVIGVLAAAQRGYFAGNDANCTKLGTIAITIVAGPLNYLGVNPKMECEVPQPSR